MSDRTIYRHYQPADYIHPLVHMGVIWSLQHHQDFLHIKTHHQQPEKDAVIEKEARPWI